MRIFIGIELPENVKNFISSFVEKLKVADKGWENPHDYHLTLLFIGEIKPELISPITYRLDRLLISPLTITLNHISFFNRRVMYVGVQETKLLLDLHDIINKSFAEFYDPSEKPFVPHITLKRWQRYEFEDLKLKVNENPFRSISFTINNVALFKSEKNSKGEKYHVIYKPERT